MKSYLRKGIATWMSICLGVMSLVGSRVEVEAKEQPNLDVWVQNSADRAFESSTMPRNPVTDIHLYSAKNEYEAAQVLVRSEDKLTNLVIESGELVSEMGEIIPASSVEIFREYSNPAAVSGDCEPTPDGSDLYTDALLHNEAINLEANKTQPYWVRIYVPEEQGAGSYQGSLVVKTDEESEEIPIHVKVYDITIPKTNEANFKMLNWFGSAGCDFGALESSVPSQYDVEMYDENWWKVMENFAKDLAIHRNNVEFIDFQALLMPLSTVDNEGNYLFDWSYFDRLVEIFIDAGALQYIYSPPSYLQLQGNEMYIHMMKFKDGKMIRELEKIDTPETNSYMDILFSALKEHLDEKGWTDIFYISALDEPSTKAQVEGSKWFYKKVKEHLPDVKNSEAHHKFTTGLEESMTTFTPILSVYDENQDYYQKLVERGKELWIYTCIGPQGDYLNRFIPYHLSKTRLIPWYIYKIGASGYLHWGYSWWRNSDTFDSKQTGDEWLVRPDKENYDVFSSVRHEAQLDGIEDYELIKILEEINPSQAQAIVDNIMKNATVYVKSGIAINSAHKAILDCIESNGEKLERVPVPVFLDDFTNGYDASWNRNSGKWTTRYQDYRYLGSQDSEAGMATAKNWYLPEGEVSIKIKIEGEEAWGGVILGKHTEEDQLTESGYLVSVNKMGNVKVVYQGDTVAEANIGEVGERGRILRVASDSNQLKVYVENQTHPVITINTQSNLGGYISLNASGGNVIFDDIIFSSYTGPVKPTQDLTIAVDQGYKDTFNKGELANWDKKGIVKVNGESLRLEGKSTAGLTRRVFGDVAVSFEMKLVDEQHDDGWAGVAIGKETASGEITQVGGYRLAIKLDGTVELVRDNNQVIAKGKTLANLQGFTKVKLEREGSTIRVYVGEDINPIIETTDETYGQGFFSFEADGIEEAFFDSLVISGIQNEEAFMMIDDFSGDLSAWNKTQYADYSYISDGILYTKGVVQEGVTGVSPELVLKGQSFNNAIYSLDVKIDKTVNIANWAGVFFNSPGERGFWKDGGYLVYLENNGKLHLYKFGVGELATVESYTNPMEDYVNLKISFIDSHIKVYVNHATAPAIDVIDEGYTSGYFGLMSDFSDARYDNIKYALPMEIVDDFSTESGKWNYVKQSDKISVVDGVLKLEGKVPGEERGVSPEVVLKNKIIEDGFVSFDMKITDKQLDNQNFWAGCAVKSTTDQGFWGNGGYLIYYATDGKLSLFRENVGEIITKDTFISPVGEFVNVKIELQDSTIRVYINHSTAPIIEVKDDAFKEGYISLIGDWVNVEFDNVKAKGLKNKENEEAEKPLLNQPFADDFEKENLENWKTINKNDGKWEISEGQYYGVGTSGANPVMANLERHVYTDATISFDMSQHSKNSWSGISFRREKPTHTVWNSGYMLFYDQSNGGLTLYSAARGPLISTDIGTSNGESIHFEIKMKKNNFKVYVNNGETPVIDYTDSNNDYSEGYVALCSYMAKAKFDNVVIEVEEEKEDVIENQPFADDFETSQAKDWVTVKESDGTWKLVDGKYQGIGTSGADPVIATLKGHTYTDASIQFEMSQHTKNSWSGIILRRNDANDSMWNSGYTLYYDQSTGGLNLFKAHIGDVATANIGESDGETIQFRVDMKENNIKVFIDQETEPVIDYIDDQCTYKNGYIGLCAYLAEAKFDNVKIEVEQKEEIQAILQGLEVINGSEDFELILGILNDNHPIYAADLQIIYDESLLTLNEVRELESTIIAGSDEVEDGTLRVLLARPEGETVNEMQLIALNFRAQSVQEDQKTIVEVAESEWGMIDEENASILKGKPIQKEIVILKEQVTEKDPEDVNEDKVINIADLALVAYYYGVTDEDEALWQKAQKVDVNKDGLIDIKDLSQVANKILE